MRRLLALAFLAATTLAPLRAQADVQACVSASEKGQRSRAAGKLRDAQKQFQICSEGGCPSLVRRDCSQWQGEIAGLVPSVVFGARDRAGRDLFDVTVKMDGETLVKSLDGKSVAVDPGPHTFLFEMPGQPGVTERVLVKEGEKARALNVVLGAEAASKDAPAPPSSSPPSGSGPTGASDPGAPPVEQRPHTVAPWIVVGVGGAVMVSGLVYILATPDLPANCNQETETCERLEGQSNAQYKEQQDTAGQHDAQPLMGGIVVGIGAAITAGGLLWHFLEPTGPRARAVTVTPWTTATGSGVVLGGRF